MYKLRDYDNSDEQDHDWANSDDLKNEQYEKLISNLKNECVTMEELQEYKIQRGELPSNSLITLLPMRGPLDPQIVEYIIENSAIRTKPNVVSEIFSINRIVLGITARHDFEKLVDAVDIFIDSNVYQSYFNYSNQNSIMLLVKYIMKNDYTNGWVEVFRRFKKTGINFDNSQYYYWLDKQIDNPSDEEIIAYSKQGRIIMDSKLPEVCVRNIFINLYHINRKLPDDMLYEYTKMLNDLLSTNNFIQMEDEYYKNYSVSNEFEIIKKLYKLSQVTYIGNTFVELIKYVQYTLDNTDNTPKAMFDTEDDDYIWSDDVPEINFLLEFMKRYNTGYSLTELKNVLSKDRQYHIMTNTVNKIFEKFDV